MMLSSSSTVLKARAHAPALSVALSGRSLVLDDACHIKDRCSYRDPCCLQAESMTVCSGRVVGQELKEDRFLG